MGSEDDPRALLDRVANRGERLLNARVVFNASFAGLGIRVSERNVEIEPHENSFARDLEIPDGTDVGDHWTQAPLRAMWSVRSIIRAEKPDSLSYQERTFTKFPSSTLVIERSIVELFSQPL